MNQPFEANSQSTSNVMWASTCITLASAICALSLYQGHDLPIALSLAFAFTLGAVYFIDVQKRTYRLANRELSIIHPTLFFLQRRYDIGEFQFVRYTTGKGGTTVYLHRSHGFPISMPLLGTVPELIAAMNSIHPIPKK